MDGEGMWNSQKRTKKTEPFWGERERRLVTCGSHPTFNLSPFHHLSHLHHITHVLWPFSSSYWSALTFMGSGKTEKERGGRRCKDRSMTVRENVIDLRGNNASEVRIFIFPHMYLNTKSLLFSINFCSLQKAFQMLQEFLQWSGWTPGRGFRFS